MCLGVRSVLTMLMIAVVMQTKVVLAATVSSAGCCCILALCVIITCDNLLLCCCCDCSCAAIHKTAEPPVTAEAPAASSSNGNMGTSTLQANTSTAAVTSLLPAEVVSSLLLQLFPCIQHPTPAATGNGSGFLTAQAPAWQHSSSSSSMGATPELAWLQQQLQLLVQPHIPASVRGAAAAAAATCNASSSPCSPCCQAGFVVLRNLATLIIADTSRSLAADKGLAKGELYMYLA
jgi:hypothetical protein